MVLHLAMLVDNSVTMVTESAPQDKLVQWVVTLSSSPESIGASLDLKVGSLRLRGTRPSRSGISAISFHQVHESRLTAKSDCLMLTELGDTRRNQAFIVVERGNVCAAFMQYLT